MKTLLLLRHGKSDWDADYVGDHERPVAKRGRNAAARIGRFIAKSGQVPELVICSTSLRTRQTLEIAMQAGEWRDVDVRHEKGVYLAGYDQIVSIIAACSDAIEALMIVGHEPTTSLVAGHLIGSASIDFPTAAVARIDLNIDTWSRCRSGVGTLVWHVIPKLLK